MEQLPCNQRRSEDSRDITIESRTEQQMTYCPIAVPERHHALDFRPLMLSTPALLIVTLVHLGALCGVLTLYFCADEHFQYQSTNSNTYFFAHYVPGIIGTITSMSYRAVYECLVRITPYRNMAAGHSLAVKASKSNAEAEWERLSKKCATEASHFKTVKFRYFWFGSSPLFSFSPGLRLQASYGWTYRMSTFTIAFKVVLLGTRLATDGSWIVIVRPFAVVLLSLGYTVFVIQLLVVLIDLWRHPTTGLKWDVTTIADRLALFHRSNITGEFGNWEICNLPPFHWWRSPEKHYSQSTHSSASIHSGFLLGYWEVGCNKDILYGIATMYEQPPEESRLSTSSSMDEVHSPSGSNEIVAYAARRWPYEKHSCYEKSHVIFWLMLLMTGFGLCTYLIVKKAYIRGFYIRNIFPSICPPLYGPCPSINTTGLIGDPHTWSNLSDLTPTDNKDHRYSLTFYGLLLRSIPATIAISFATGFVPTIDIAHRFSQPFRNMHGRACPADMSLTLDYTYASPILISIAAIKAHHWKVAWFSCLATASSPFPVLIAGMFDITHLGEYIYIRVSNITFWAIFSYISIFMLSLCFAFPTTNRSLPMHCYNIRDLLALTYASKILEDPVLNITDPRINKEYFEASVAWLNHKFQLGLFNCSDNHTHFGIDIQEEDAEGIPHVHDVVTVGSGANWKLIEHVYWFWRWCPFSRKYGGRYRRGSEGSEAMGDQGLPLSRVTSTSSRLTREESLEGATTSYEMETQDTEVHKPISRQTTWSSMHIDQLRDERVGPATISYDAHSGSFQTTRQSSWPLRSSHHTVV